MDKIIKGVDHDVVDAPIVVKLPPETSGGNPKNLLAATLMNLKKAKKQ